MLLFVAALATLLPGPARAALDTQEDAILAMYDFGRCVALYDSVASSVLGLPPGSQMERELLRKISNPRCLNGQGFVYTLDYEPQLLRGAIAEELLGREDGERVNGRTIRWVAPFTGLTEADIAALDERGRSSLNALDFAQCLLADAPEAVEAVLVTRPTKSPEERAFLALIPFLGPCLPEGAQMSISKPQLRSFLAEAYYRREYAAHHGSPAQSSEG
jgi:hypothetical protein